MGSSFSRALCRAASAFGALLAAAMAFAADLPTAKGPPPAPPPPIDYYQPFFVKVGFTYALNTSSSQLWAQNPIAMSYGNFATFPLGVGATIGDLPTVGFEGGVFVTRNVSLDVSFGIPYYVDVKTKGYNPQNPILTNGTVLSQIMPSFVPVTALYHFDNFGAFRPYLGTGLAPNFSFSNKNAFTTGVHVGSSVGPVLQAGFDYMMTPKAARDVDPLLWLGRALLLVRSSYRVEWNFPGGTIKRGETPDAAARRELAEEIGLTASGLLPAGDASGIWDGRRDRVHFFELRLDQLPELRLDNREIIGARLVRQRSWATLQ